MKVLIADKLSAKAVSDLEKLGAQVVVNPELTADDLAGALGDAEILVRSSGGDFAPADVDRAGTYVVIQVTGESEIRIR